MPGHHPIFDLRRPEMNTDQVRNLATTILATAAWTPLSLPLPKASNELFFQRASGHHIERVVDGLVGDLTCRVIWIHALQCDGYLPRRPVLAQQVGHQIEERRTKAQLRLSSCSMSRQRGPETRQTGVIASMRRYRMPSQFPRNCAGSSPKVLGDGAYQVTFTHQHDGGTFFSSKVVVAMSHSDSVPDRSGVALAH